MDKDTIQATIDAIDNLFTSWGERYDPKEILESAELLERVFQNGYKSEFSHSKG